MKRKPKPSTVDENKRAELKDGIKSLIDFMAPSNEKFVARVDSDEPLTPEVRKRIAEELRRYYASPSYAMTVATGRQFSDDQINYALLLKGMLRQEAGMTAAEAERDVADMLGLSVEALRKRFQRQIPRGRRR
jgi:hypothetical protein